MPNVLRRLKIREVSSVDRGAGEGVRVMLFKRALSEEHPTGDTRPPRKGKKERPPQTLFQHQQRARAQFDTGSPKGGNDARSHRGFSAGTGDKSRRGRQRHLKRDTEGQMPATETLPPKVEKYLARNVLAEAEVAKRDVSSKERQRLAAEGHAMSGGGFPIANVSDLKNAIRAIGRAKNPGKTRAHIRRQAARLGRSDLIPDTWSGGMNKLSKVAGFRGRGFGTHRSPGRGYSHRRKAAFPGAAEPFGADKKKPSRKTAKALLGIAKDLAATRELLKGSTSFDEMMAEMSSMDYAEGLVEAIRDATHAIKDSIESIADCDDLMPNEKATAIAESLDQFKDHIAGIAPGNITKALKEDLGKMTKLQKKIAKTYTSVPAHAAKPPAKDGDTKIVNDADEDVTEAGSGTDVKTATNKKALRKALRKAQKKIAKLQGRAAAALELSKAERQYMDDAGDDMDADDKKKFLDLSHEKREKFIKKHPIADIAKAHVEALPEPIRKQLAEGAEATEKVAKMTEAAEVADFAKRANTLGQPAAFGAHLRTLAKGSGTEEERGKAYEAVETALKSANEAARLGGVFREFGSGLGGTGSAWDQLMAKAEELRTNVAKANGAALTPEQAFEKVYTDPTNRELVKQYNAEKNRAV